MRVISGGTNETHLAPPGTPCWIRPCARQSDRASVRGLRASNYSHCAAAVRLRNACGPACQAAPAPTDGGCPPLQPPHRQHRTGSGGGVACLLPALRVTCGFRPTLGRGPRSAFSVRSGPGQGIWYIEKRPGWGQRSLQQASDHRPNGQQQLPLRCAAVQFSNHNIDSCTRYIYRLGRVQAGRSALPMRWQGSVQPMCTSHVARIRRRRDDDTLGCRK